MSATLLQEFLGWCLVINVIVLTFSTIMILIFRGMISRIHGKMFHLSEVELTIIYMQYLSFYKIIIIIFNLVPYIALRIMN